MSVVLFLFGAVLAESIHWAIAHRAALLAAALTVPARTAYRFRRRFIGTGTRVKPRPAKPEAAAIAAPPAQKAITA